MTEVSNGDGYATGGATVGSPTIGTTTTVTKFDGADPSWTVTGSGFTYRYASFYDSTPGGTWKIFCTQPFGQAVIASQGHERWPGSPGQLHRVLR